MKEIFMDIRFNTASVHKIEQANEIIDEYSQKGFTLTLRQLYYQFVARAFIENSEKSYKNLGKLISNGRLAGEINWSAIEDRTRSIGRPFGWSSPKHILESAATEYHRDRWVGQEYRVEVWIEKEALAGVIEPVCRRWDLTSFSCRGYVSQSVQWQAAKHVEDEEAKTVILHLGDHDPSGIDMTRDIEDRLTLLSNGTPFILKRIALNMDQVEEFDPPPNPTKLSDSRAEGYVEKFGTSSWELDALQPEFIDKLIESEALKYIDVPMREAILAVEEVEREKIQVFADTWTDENQ